MRSGLVPVDAVRVEGETVVKLTIDGIQVTASEGASVLEAAAAVGIDIPNLCYDRRLGSFGACRLCIVEIEGVPGLKTSCSTAVAEGMVVHTETPQVVEARKLLLELLLSDHPQDCLTCDQAGDCRLQDYCYRYGVADTPYRGAVRSTTIDERNPLIARDQSKCILCGKCVAVCEKVQGTSAIDFAGRSFETRISTSFDRPLDTDICRLCGQCIDVCPTGALSNRQLTGSRTWERHKVRTVCPFCGTGCGLDLNVRNGVVVGVTAADDAVVNEGSLCVKGRFHTDLISSPDRITQPLIKRDGAFVPASWDEALDLVAERLTAVKDQHGPQAIAALSSARCTNEDNWAMQRFVRAALGSNNIDHCART